MKKSFMPFEPAHNVLKIKLIKTVDMEQAIK